MTGRSSTRRRLARGLVLALSLSAWVGTVAAQGPAARPRPPVDELKALLLDASQSDRARIRAANLLGEHDDPRAQGVLVQALADAKPAIRFGAARALGRPGWTTAVEPLEKLLGVGDEPAFVRAAAARSLGAIGSERAVPALLAARAATAAEVRTGARQGLLALRSATLPLSRADLLVEIVTDAEAPEAARAEAAQGLVETPDSRRVPVLIAALEAPESSSAPAGPASLPELLQARLQARNSLGAAAARGLARLGAREAIPSLITAARTRRGETRVAAFEALARLRAPEAIPVAIAGLDDSDPRARRWAAVLLAALQPPEALGRLRTALADTDDGVRLQAVLALHRMADAGAVDELARALEREKVPQVRQALQEALAGLEPLLYL